MQAILNSTDRSTSELAELSKYLLKLTFFNKLQKEADAETIKECAKCIYMQTCLAGEVNTIQNCITQGEIGSQYYIMMSGAASIYINNPIYNAEGQLITDKIKVGAVNPGVGFGELALLNSKPRAATIKCDVESTFAVLEKRDYLRILKKFDERRLNALIDFFKALPMFENWTRQAVGKLTYYFKEVELARNSFVYREGDAGEAVFFVKRGDFNLLKSMPQQATDLTRRLKKEYAYVAILGVGEMFGNQEVLEATPRLHSCQCASSSGSVLRIEKSDFLRKIAFTSNLPKLTQLSVLRHEAHSKRVQEIEEIKQLLQSSPLKSRSDKTKLRVKKRSYSKVEPSLGPSFEYPPTDLSYDHIEIHKVNRTMTNLKRLPELSFRSARRKVPVSPTRNLKKSVVKNIHVQALRDRCLNYFDQKPYRAFTKRRLPSPLDEDSLIAVSSFDYSEKA